MEQTPRVTLTSTRVSAEAARARPKLVYIVLQSIMCNVGFKSAAALDIPRLPGQINRDLPQIILVVNVFKNLFIRILLIERRDCDGARVKDPLAVGGGSWRIAFCEGFWDELAVGDLTPRIKPKFVHFFPQNLRGPQIFPG